MSEPKAILIEYNVIDSQDSWRNLAPTSILLFRNTKEAKNYVVKKYNADSWYERYNNTETIKIFKDKKNKPNDYIQFDIIKRQILTKIDIANLLAPKKKLFTF